MSDFTSSFWPWYIAGITVVSILACGVLLYLAGKVTVVKQGGVDDHTTGHVWDENLTEYNNPLPRWWLGLFVLTIVVSLVYLVIFPGLGSFKGTLNWSTDQEHRDDTVALQAQVAPLYSALVATPLEVLAKDPRALAIGERLFMNNCSQCHGSDGGGSKGFPNLTNSNATWLGERSAEYIVATVTHGRTGVMPPMAAVVGGEKELSEVANYVLSLSASPHNDIKAHSGKALFSSCAACHGVNGQGNKAIGAPNLADNFWLHGWGEAAIISAIKNGKNNVMPAQSPKMTAEQIHVVSAYVMSLSQSSLAASATQTP